MTNLNVSLPKKLRKSATTLVPDAIRKVAGMYYRIGLIGDNSSSVTWPSLLAPEGCGF